MATIDNMKGRRDYSAEEWDMAPFQKRNTPTSNDYVFFMAFLNEISDSLYCATIALDGYSSHLGKIHYIQDGNLCLYMWHHLLQTLAINTPGLITPPIHFTSGWLLLPSEPSQLVGHILSSSTSALIYHVCTSKSRPDPAVPIISERSHGMW